jgi:hypothetical protein
MFFRFKVWCRRLWWWIRRKGSPTGITPGDVMTIDHCDGRPTETYVVSSVIDQSTVKLGDDKEMTL